MTAHRSSATTAGVRSYRDALDALDALAPPEAKSLAPGGSACTPDTVGLLKHRPVFAARTIAIGKEAHRLEDVEREDVHDLDEVQTAYGDIGPDPWTAHVLPILRELPRALLAAVAGISERAINKLWHERTRPSPSVRAALTTFAADHARAVIAADTVDADLDDDAACMIATIETPNLTRVNRGEALSTNPARSPRVSR